MSRRIVQIAAVGFEQGGDRFETLYALDNNGVAWVLDAPGLTQSKWQRLPALPSFENPTPRPPAIVEPSTTTGE